jgi:EmrB/QacA subfamily drug resistance transporter
VIGATRKVVWMRKWLPLLTVCLGSFMLLVDVTIVNVALPQMAFDLDASFTALQWVIDVYAIALAALLLGAGALADRVGHRLVYVGGLALFAVSSLACGFAPGTGSLIVVRGFQGVGAAAMFATTIALINASYEGRDRGIAFGVWGAVNGAAAAAGPIAGGLLTDGLSWRWIFFVNLPVSVAAVTMSIRALPREERRAGPRVDVSGVATFTVAAGALTYALTRAPEIGWTAAPTLALLATAVTALIAFIVSQLRASNPIIELSLLRRPAFSGVLAASLLLPVAAFSYFPLTSLWLQSVQGMSPIRAGLALVPLSLAALVTALIVGRVLDGASPRALIGAGLALIGAGALVQAHLGAGSTSASLIPGLVITGVGVGLATPTLASAALAAVPVQRGGMAAGAVNTMRQLGYALGIAVLGAIGQAQITDALRADHVSAAPGRLVADLVSGKAGALLAHAPVAQRPHLDAAIHTTFPSGLNAALVAAGIVGIAGAALVAIMVRARPERVEAAPGSPRAPRVSPSSADLG